MDLTEELSVRMVCMLRVLRLRSKWLFMRKALNWIL
jgi:hypothetical protein